MILQGELPIDTLLCDEKPLPFKVKTKPPLMLPCSGEILCTDGMPVTVVLEEVESAYPWPFGKNLFY